MNLFVNAYVYLPMIPNTNAHTLCGRAISCRFLDYFSPFWSDYRKQIMNSKRKAIKRETELLKPRLTLESQALVCEF